MIRNSIFVCLLLVAASVNAQSVEGKLEHDKTERWVAMVELPYNSDIIEDAIDKQLSGKGKTKGKEIRGFDNYKMPNPSKDGMDGDLYFRVEEKRKEKKVSVVYLLVGPQILGESPDIRHLNMKESIELLNSLLPHIHAFALDKMIEDQKEEVAKASKKYQSLTEDGRDLEKKKESIEKDIKSNKQDQNKQSDELEAEKKKLSELVKRKKS